MKTKHFFLLILASILVACANPINRATYNKYYRWGWEAEQAQEYSLAKENYYRALNNARAGNLEPRYHASASYALGRMQGVLCEHEEAETLLLEAVKFDTEAKGPVYMSYNELARLYLDTGQFAKAVSYYKKSLVLVDKQNFLDKDPIGFSILFHEYAQALHKTGRVRAADKYRQRAEQLRTKYPKKQPQSERTPYLLNCKVK